MITYQSSGEEHDPLPVSLETDKTTSPHLNPPVTGNLPSGAETATRSCPLPAAHSGVLLQELALDMRAPIH